MSHEYNDFELCYKSWKFRQVGGFWSIGRNLINYFIRFVRNEIQLLFDSKYNGCDEDIMARFLYVNPDKCCVSFGDYGVCISNWVRLQNQIQFVPNVLVKFQKNSQHKFAIQGFGALIKELVDGYLKLNAFEIFFLLYGLYQSLIHLNTTKAKITAILILQCAHVNRELSKFIQDDLFLEILSSNELKTIRNLSNNFEAPFKIYNSQTFGLVNSHYFNEQILSLCGLSKPTRIWEILCHTYLIGNYNAT